MRVALNPFLRFHLGVLMIMGLLTSAPSTGRGESISSAPLAGAYRFIGGESEIERMDRAIDDAVEELNFLIRGLARRRLREPNFPSERLRIVEEGAQIRIERTGQPDIAAPADGSPIEWRNPENGNTLEIRHEMAGPRVLEQQMRGDRGLSVNRYVLSDDGSNLTVRTVITADKLSAPVRFSTTYAREKGN